jgi:hypothetical protein
MLCSAVLDAANTSQLVRVLDLVWFLVLADDFPPKINRQKSMVKIAGVPQVPEVPSNPRKRRDI